MTVTGQSDIALDAVGAFLQGQLVRRQRVLGARRRRPPVSDDEGVSAVHLVG